MPFFVKRINSVVELINPVRLLATPWTVALCPWDFPGKSTGKLLPFPSPGGWTQGSILRWQVGPLLLSHQGSTVSSVRKVADTLAHPETCPQMTCPGAAILCDLMPARSPSPKCIHTQEMLGGRGQHSALPARRAGEPPFSLLGCQKLEQQSGNQHTHLPSYPRLRDPPLFSHLTLICVPPSLAQGVEESDLTPPPGSSQSL